MAKVTSPAAAAKPQQTAKPVNAKPSKGRTDFALVGNKDENIYPFKIACPEGFDFKTNRPLKKRDFVDEAVYLEYRATELEFKAKAFRVQAEEARKLGSVKDRAKAKRLVKLQEKMAELKKQLSDQGIDIEALLKTEPAAA